MGVNRFENKEFLFFALSYSSKKLDLAPVDNVNLTFMISCLYDVPFMGGDGTLHAGEAADKTLMIRLIWPSRCHFIEGHDRNRGVVIILNTGITSYVFPGNR